VASRIAHQQEVTMIVRRAALLAAATLAIASTAPDGRPASRGHDASARLCAFHNSHVPHGRFH
jgi:hypothetical protein